MKKVDYRAKERAIGAFYDDTSQFVEWRWLLGMEHKYINIIYIITPI